jgi:hypothetical protein
LSDSSNNVRLTGCNSIHWLLDKIQMKKSLNSPNSLKEALEEFWNDRSDSSSHIPDYAGFDAWYQKVMSEMKSEAGSMPAVHHTRGIQSNLFSIFDETARAFEEAGIIVSVDRFSPDPDRFGKWDGKGSKLKRQNKAKLLLYLDQLFGERLRGLIVTLQQASNKKPYRDITRRSPTTEIRAAFFSAVAESDSEFAHKAVGFLREEDHDRGEIAYLDAVAAFNANRFEEATQHALSVSSEDLDWPRAHSIRIESEALLGHLDNVLEALAEDNDRCLTPCFRTYVLQRCIENSIHPEADIEKVIETVNSAEFELSTEDDFFKPWNRYSCEIAVKLVELSRDRLKIEDFKSNEDSSFDVEELDANEPTQLEKNLALTMLLDPDLFHKISNLDLDQCSAEIVKRLINPSIPDRKDYVQAFSTQWRIGDRIAFISNIVGSLPNIKVNDDDIMEMVSLAYQEALSSKMANDAKLLRDHLILSSTFAPKLHVLEAEAAIDTIDGNLSQMGSIAYRSARWEYERLEEQNSAWRDAGMVSLGFFRILELEINKKIFEPLLEYINLNNLDDLVAEIGKESESRKTQKVKEYWFRTLKQIKSMLSSGKGFELGFAEILLGKCSSTKGPDSALKSSFFDAFTKVLNAHGVRALENGRLRKMIGVEARESYRNPPAHCRYIDFSVARECRLHVERALQDLILYTDDTKPRHGTVH